MPVRTSARRGLTLVELLVVISIIVLVLAVTVPMMQPVLQGREIREAARQVTTFLAGAQARAVAVGRPVGVILQRLPNEPRASFQLSIAEVPPPYAGDTVSARARIQPTAPAATAATGIQPPGTAQLTESGGLTRLVTAGDYIKFDYRGNLYRIEKVDFPFVYFRHPSAPPPPPTRPDGLGLPFQIYRKPRKTAAAPLELPAPAVIDLEMSGIGPTGTGNPYFLSPQPPGNPMDPVIIMFSPSGRVDDVYVGGLSDRPLASIFLLIGRADKLGMQNLQDMSSLWVTVGNRTGLVTTSENNGRPGMGISDVALARQFARTSQSIGGR